MKNSIKYLLLTAIVGFSFLNVFSNKSEKHGQPKNSQRAKTMPKIPNGDFEEWKNLGDSSYELSFWKDETPRPKGDHGYGRRHAEMPDSINPFNGKYSALLKKGARMVIQFPIAVHPSSLYVHLKCQVDKRSYGGIGVELIKNVCRVDSGYWTINQESIESWTEIIIPISKTTSKADTARITISNYSPKLEVDDLFFK